MTPELSRLLEAGTETECDEAWTELIRVHHRLVMHVARAGAPDEDTAMDAYAFLLERLREDNYRRFRAFVFDGRSTFVTWLVVVAKRLCIDFARRRYGRSTKCADGTLDGQELMRRRLVDLAGADMDLDLIADPSERTPATLLDEAILARALRDAIAELEPRDRLLLALRFEDELTAEQIATTLRLPSPFHVYRQLNRIFARLRERLRYLKEGNPAA